jgi:hypothetical protein
VADGASCLSEDVSSENNFHGPAAGPLGSCQRFRAVGDLNKNPAKDFCFGDLDQAKPK